MQALGEREGITVARINFDNIRYADDASLIADSQEKFQKLLNRAVQEGGSRVLKWNLKKTVFMVVSKKSCEIYMQVFVKGAELKQVSEFSVLTSDCCSENEIKKRIGMPTAAFCLLKHALLNTH